MPTVQDVAKLAGVSTATVSRVMSGYEHVTPKVREKVMAAVNTLGFAPNQNAKSLRTTKTHKIIVTVPNIANIFFSNVILGVEEAAQKAGYTVLLGDVGVDDRSADSYDAMLRRKEADGLIFLGYSPPVATRRMIATSTKTVPIVNGCEFNDQLGVSSVHIDNVRAAQDAMDYLYGLGHQRIGVITGSLISPISRDRLIGSRLSAENHGRSDALTIRTGDFSVESGAAIAAELLQQNPRPTAIFCFSDDMAMGTLYAIRQAGLTCPRDISVIGFDDIKFSQFMSPGLTTVRQPMREIGRKTVELLIDIIAQGQSDLVNITLEHQLIVRESTAAPPA